MIRLGYTYGTYRRPDEPRTSFASVVAQAQAAEAAGFDSVWIADHLMQTPATAPVHEPMLECYTTLGALAQATSTVRLGSFVGCPAYRNAALLGKILSTLDVISEGRAMFGIGAGWYAEEHRAYGYDMGIGGERYERMVETIEIVRSMFVNDTTTYHGKHFRTEAAPNFPRPVQTNGLPLMIGGNGPRRTLRLVAQYADLCNLVGSPDTIRHAVEVLAGHCADIGRDPAEIRRSGLHSVIIRETTEQAHAAIPQVLRDRPSPFLPIMGTRDEVVDQLADLLRAGLDGLILACNAEDAHPEYVTLLGEVAAEALATVDTT